MALDKRVPAIYVEIEDRSLALETTQGGRSGYVVLLSDRGPHNRVVELNSREDLYDNFGKPDFMRYGQAHYLADKFLTFSNRLYAVRPALLDPNFNMDTEVEDCMAISNCHLKVNDIDDAIDVDGDFNLVSGSNIITAVDTTSLVNLQVGEWIVADGDNESLVRQIVKIEEDITLDAVYSGETATTTLKSYTPVEAVTTANFRDSSTINTQDGTILWHFYAVGAGKYYNNVFIRGTRNLQLEKMYTDNDGVPLYPNMFMDISINVMLEDGTSKMLEGPWSVSLVDRTPSGNIIRDVFSGTQLYLPVVINNNSKIIECSESLGSLDMMTSEQEYPYAPDVAKRVAVQSIFSEGDILGMNVIGEGGFFLESGSDGNLYDERGLLNFVGNEQYEALVSQAYEGALESTDGSVELIVQEIYPAYLFDYILCGGYNASINNSARLLVDKRNDCLLLSDTGSVINSAEEDLIARQESVPWNTWNAALYVQYRKITDIHTGKKFNITPVYHAIERHLLVDNNYWIAEPVAGIEKGAISDPIELQYRANFTKLGDMLDAEMNPVIVEPEGTYILSQFSTWKRLSVMKRLHVVKFIQFIKKRLPTLLKDILNRKATAYWINQARLRVNGFMITFVEGSSTDRYAALKSFDAKVSFDDVRSEINVVLTVVPIRAIERIHVNIIVT